MHGWIKHFVNGTKEIGTDEDVAANKASWSKGRLIGIAAAEIIHGNKRMAILSPGRFWQSDDYEVSYGEPTPSMRVRRLQRQIQSGDYMFVVSKDANTMIVNMLQPNQVHSTAIDVRGMIGRWLTIEYDITTQRFSCRIEEHMI